MGKDIRKHKINKIRSSFGDIEIYNITNENKSKLEEIIKEASTIISKNENVELETKIEGTALFRELLMLLTNIDLDHIDDEELSQILTNPDKDLKATLIEITDIVRELNQDKAYNIKQQLYVLDEFSNEIEIINELSNKLNSPVEKIIELVKREQEGKSDEE